MPFGLFIGALIMAFPVGATVLTGRVYSDKGGPVDGAVIAVQATAFSTSPVVSYGAQTDAQGKFTVTIPDAATYSICVGAFDRSLLNSCEWSLQQSLVSVAKGQ